MLQEMKIKKIGKKIILLFITNSFFLLRLLCVLNDDFHARNINKLNRIIEKLLDVLDENKFLTIHLLKLFQVLNLSFYEQHIIIQLNY